jgi:hypothetical protein
MEEITPELVQMAAEYFGINEDAALQKLLHAQAQKARETPMGLTVRDQYIAPSVFGTAASTIERIRGGQDEQAALAKLQAGILRKKDINTSAMQADMQRRMAEAEPATLQPSNGAMMSPDPSTMTDENAFQAQWTNPWEMEPTAAKAARAGGGRSLLTDTSPQRGRGYTGAPVPVPPAAPQLGPTQSPLFGWRDVMGLFGRK